MEQAEELDLRSWYESWEWEQSLPSPAKDEAAARARRHSAGLAFDRGRNEVGGDDAKMLAVVCCGVLAERFDDVKALVGDARSRAAPRPDPPRGALPQCVSGASLRSLGACRALQSLQGARSRHRRCGVRRDGGALRACVAGVPARRSLRSPQPDLQTVGDAEDKAAGQPCLSGHQTAEEMTGQPLSAHSFSSGMRPLAPRMRRVTD